AAVLHCVRTGRHGPGTAFLPRGECEQALSTPERGVTASEMSGNFGYALAISDYNDALMSARFLSLRNQAILLGPGNIPTNYYVTARTTYFLHVAPSWMCRKSPHSPCVVMVENKGTVVHCKAAGQNFVLHTGRRVRSNAKNFDPPVSAAHLYPT